MTRIVASVFDGKVAEVELCLGHPVVSSDVLTHNLLSLKHIPTGIYLLSY